MRQVTVTVAVIAVFIVVSLVVGGVVADAGASGPFGCVSPERQIATIQRAHPGAVAHAMRDAEFAAFAEAMGLRFGDAAVWFERSGVATAYIVVFAERCRVGGGEISRERLSLLLGRAEA